MCSPFPGKGLRSYILWNTLTLDSTDQIFVIVFGLVKYMWIIAKLMWVFELHCLYLRVSCRKTIILSHKCHQFIKIPFPDFVWKSFSMVQRQDANVLCQIICNLVVYRVGESKKGSTLRIGGCRGTAGVCLPANPQPLIPSTASNSFVLTDRIYSNWGTGCED